MSREASAGEPITERRNPIRRCQTKGWRDPRDQLGDVPILPERHPGGLFGANLNLEFSLGQWRVGVWSEALTYLKCRGIERGARCFDAMPVRTNIVTDCLSYSTETHLTDA